MNKKDRGRAPQSFCVLFLFLLDIIDLIVIFVEHQRDVEVAVQRADLINKLLLICIGLDADRIDQIEQGSEIGRLNAAEHEARCILLKDLIKEPVVVEVLRNRDLERHILCLRCCEVDEVEEIHSVEEDSLVEMPSIATNSNCNYFYKVVKEDKMLILLIDPNKLLSQEEQEIAERLAKEE